MTVQELNTILGKNIKMYREEKGLTQDWLAQKIGGLYQNVISRYETGVRFPHASTLIELAGVLGVEPWQLFYNHEIMKKDDSVNALSVLLSVKETAPILKCRNGKLRKLIHTGKIGCKRIGRSYFFTQDHIQEFLNHTDFVPKIRIKKGRRY